MRLAVFSHACIRAINRNIYIELMRRGLDVQLIVALEYMGRVAEPRRDEDPPIYFLSLSSDHIRRYRYLGAKPVLDEIRPDAVLIEADPASVLALDIGRWCRRNGVKLIAFTGENLDFSFWAHLRRVGLRSLPNAAAKSFIARLTRRYVDQVFTVSQDGVDVFQRNGYRGVVKALLGYDPSVFFPNVEARARARAQFGIDSEAIVFSCFGRLVPLKGIHLVVGALVDIANSGTSPREWRLLLNRFEANDNYGCALIERIEQSGFGSHVIFFTADHYRIADYMNASDVVILASVTYPTLKEQYGRVIPEAMACGALAVVSDSGAPKELVGDCGIVFPEGDRAALKRILADVLANPDKYRSLRERGAKRAAENFTIARQADVYMDAIGQLTGGQSR